MTEWAVTVSNTDPHPGAVRVYGPFRSLRRAEGFCADVREAADQVLDDDEDHEIGYAYVHRIRKDLAEARGWLSQ